MVGLGWWGRTIVESVQGTSDVIRFVAGATRTVSPEVQAFADTQKLRLAESFDAVLKDPEVDAIVLATPHSQHTGQVAAAAKAGKHVFCEKPFALTKADADEAVAAVKKAGVTLGLGYNRRFHPEMTALRQRIDSGDLGTVLHIEATMTFPNALFLKADAWRADREETPCGGLTPMGVHAIDGMIDLSGPINSVFCQSFRRVVAVDSDDTTSMLFRMKDGSSGYLGTMTATGPGFSFQVFGSKGWVRLEGVAQSPVHLPLDLAALGAGVARLEPRVQQHVRHHALAEALAGEHGARVVRRDPIERAAQRGVVRQVLVGLQHQRIEEQHAELPVAGPRLVGPEALERADVDEHRPRAAPLDVVGRCVLERKVRPQRAPVELELEQRGVLEHRERPLVGIGDERHALVPQHARGCAREQVGMAVERRRLRRHDAALVHQLPPQRRGDDRLPVLQSRAAQDAEDAVRRGEHATLMVAEGAGLGAQGSGACSGSGSGLRIRSTRRILYHQSFTATASAARPPTSSWTSMLPVPGSRYANTGGSITTR